MQINKFFSKPKLYLILLPLVVFFSCNTNLVTKISISKTTIALNVGQSDTLSATVTYSGEIDGPIVWTVENPDIVSFTEGTGGRASVSTQENSIDKQIVIKALKPGTTMISLKAGDKTIDCKVTVSQKNYNFNKAFAANWGDFYEFGTNNFEIYLLENSLTVNDSGKISGLGTFLILDFNVAITQNSLSEANFIASKNRDINTFYPGEFFEFQNQTYVEGTRVIKVDQTNTTTTLVKEGAYSVKFTDTGYIIEGNLILSTDESIHFSYTGPVNVVDNREVPVEISPVLTKGQLYYYGVAYNNAPSNNFVAYLASESVNFSDTVWNGDILMLEINTPLTVTNSIPDGTYNMIAKLTEASDLVPTSLVFGYETESGDRWGTWFFGDTVKKIKTGNIVVSKTGNQYSINYTLFDKIGSKVYGTYTGPLSFVDGTVPAAAGSPARVKGFNQKKSISTIQHDRKIKQLRVN